MRQGVGHLHGQLPRVAFFSVPAQILKIQCRAVRAFPFCGGPESLIKALLTAMYMVALAVSGELIESPLEMKAPGGDPICVSADGSPEARVRSQVLPKLVE